MADLTDTYYPAEGKFHGYGTQWMIGDGASPEEFEAVAEVVNIAPGKMSTAVFDRTHLRSPNAHREKLLALRDSEVFTMQLNYRPKHESQSYTGGGSGSFTSGGVLRHHVERLEKTHKIVLTDGSPATEFEFTGGITGYQVGAIGTEDGPNLTVEVTPLNGSWHSNLP